MGESKEKSKVRKKMKLWKKIVITVVVIILIMGIAAFFFIQSMFTPQQLDSAKASDETIVEIADGSLRGSMNDGVYQYLGVPYAEAAERFVPAEKVAHWDEVRDATSVGAISPQSAMLGMSGNQEGTDNNCQNLNIWTPGIEDGEKRAVMVWLHGGGFSSGSGNDAQYSGLDLSQSGDIVVVSVNHRLGASGFLDLSAYGDKYQYSGNVGVEDIIMALQWIQENIEQFGGNPDNVTLFGQSGGGAKILALMTSSRASGLFDRGIIQSGATETMGVTFSSQKASTALADRILENLGISESNIEDIQAVDMSDIEDASTEALQETAEEFQIPAPFNSGYAMEWGPVVDGDYLPTNPVTEESFADNGKDIDLLIGSNLNEWTTMMGRNQGEMTKEEVKAYTIAYPNEDPNGANLVDTLIRLPMLKIMSHKADQNSANVYSYVLTWNETSRGAYHGIEIPLVFNHKQSDEKTQKLAEQVSQAWVNFAKKGVPSADGLPEWEAYTREGGATMILDNKSSLVYSHDRELMRLLRPDYEY